VTDSEPTDMNVVSALVHAQRPELTAPYGRSIALSLARMPRTAVLEVSGAHVARTPTQAAVDRHERLDRSTIDTILTDPDTGATETLRYPTIGSELAPVYGAMPSDPAWFRRTSPVAMCSALTAYARAVCRARGGAY